MESDTVIFFLRPGDKDELTLGCGQLCWKGGPGCLSYGCVYQEIPGICVGQERDTAPSSDTGTRIENAGVLFGISRVG